MAIEIKLVVDKKMNRVIFAECDSDFVDVLFSFMTLPLGTIVRIFDKQSGLGCIDKLYESVEKLDVKYLQTAACKNMLLRPRNVAEELCENLVVNINDLEPRSVLICKNWPCTRRTPYFYSSVGGVMCSCGKLMDKSTSWEKKQSNKHGVFVRSEFIFIVRDDLRTIVSSVSAAVSLFKELDVYDATMIEETIIQVEKDKILRLLKRSFVSKTSLTDVFLGQPANDNAVKTKAYARKIKIEENQRLSKRVNEPYTITVKILESKSDNMVFLMDSKNEFVDLLFSFLTFPLGSVMSLLRESSSFSLGCINNLYKSINDLNEDNSGILLVDSKDMLLNPKLPSHFRCSKHVLKVDEIEANNGTILNCKTCFENGKEFRDNECLHGFSNLALTEINPKLQKPSSENGGGFARTSMSFMITNELMVKPVSAFTTLQHFANQGISVDSIRERTVTLGELEAMKLLKACLPTRDALLPNLL